jgi:hypothetical protein
MAFSVSVAAKGLFNSVNFQLNHFQALQRTYAEAANFIHLA